MAKILFISYTIIIDVHMYIWQTYCAMIKVYSICIWYIV